MENEKEAHVYDIMKKHQCDSNICNSLKQHSMVECDKVYMWQLLHKKGPCFKMYWKLRCPNCRVYTPFKLTDQSENDHNVMQAVCLECGEIKNLIKP